MSDMLVRVIAIVSEQSGIPVSKLSAGSAIDQDLRMSGDDVTELAQALAREFGEQVWGWPWQRFALLDEALSPLLPFTLAWQLMTWPFRGAISYPSPYERLELEHIAAAVERGEWFEP